MSNKVVTVKVGKSGKEVHAKECAKEEGLAGFYDRHTACGQHGGRSSLLLLRDNVAPADLARLVTCEKCRAALALVSA